MSRFLSKRRIFILGVLVAGLFLAIYVGTRPRPVPGQVPLANLRNINALRTQFNRDAGKARLIIFVSPT